MWEWMDLSFPKSWGYLFVKSHERGRNSKSMNLFSKAKSSFSCFSFRGMRQTWSIGFMCTHYRCSKLPRDRYLTRPRTGMSVSKISKERSLFLMKDLRISVPKVNRFLDHEDINTFDFTVVVYHGDYLAIWMRTAKKVIDRLPLQE